MTIKNKPLISIIIPTFNSEKSIARCIGSVFLNEIQDFEVLIYDDGSNDQTLSIVENLYGNNKSVKVYNSTENKGAGYARRFLLKKARGKYIAFLDSDDFWYTNKLDKQITILEKTGADLVTCSYDIIDEKSSLIGERKPIRTITFFSMHLSNWLPTSMTIIRANLVGAKEMPNLRKRQDYAYWLKLFEANKIKCVTMQEKLGAYSRGSNTLSSSHFDNLKANFRMFKFHLQYGYFFTCICLISNISVRLFRK